MQVLIDIPESARAAVAFARAKFNEGKPVEDQITSEEDYLIHVINKAVDSYAVQANVPAPQPDPDPVVVNGVPQQVTRRQAIQALINQGLYASVQPAIDAITDPIVRATMNNEWNNSQMFERQRPSLIAMAQAIGIQYPEGLDALFIYAATL